MPHTTTCTVCGKTITWKRWLARNWDSLRFCSAVCRRKAVAASRSNQAAAARAA